MVKDALGREFTTAMAIKELGLTPVDGGGWEESDGLYHDSLSSVAMSRLGLCGCSDQSVSYATELLRELGKSPPPFWVDGPREFFVNMMTERNIAEHGTSVRGSWLTERGMAVLVLLDATHPGDRKEVG